MRRKNTASILMTAVMARFWQIIAVSVSRAVKEKAIMKLVRVRITMSRALPWNGSSSAIPVSSEAHRKERHISSPAVRHTIRFER